MKTLSLWQPWATLIALGEKTIETRHWATNYRGRLAIHAAKRKPDRMPVGRYRPAQPRSPKDAPWGLWWHQNGRERPDGVGGQTSVSLPLGAIVATCDLVDCLPIVGWKDGKPDNKSLPWWPTKVIAICDDDPEDVDEHGQPFARVWSCGEIRQGSEPPLGCWSSGFGENPAYGDYTPGRYGWVLENIEAVGPPVPAAGHQGLWEWSPSDAATSSTESTIGAEEAHP